MLTASIIIISIIIVNNITINICIIVINVNNIITIVSIFIITINHQTNWSPTISASLSNVLDILRKRCKIRNFIFTQLLKSFHVTIASSCYVQPLLLVYFNLLLQWEVQALPVEWALLQLARVKNVDNTKGTATIITDHINLKSKVPQETYNF